MSEPWIPVILPAGWRKVCDFGPCGAAYAAGNGLRVIVTASEPGDHDDNHAWLHVSVSRGDRLPNYDDLVRVKEIFVGTERKAMMIFPPRSKHVNIHPNCLHLYSCLDGDPLPEFSSEVEGIGRTI